MERLTKRPLAALGVAALALTLAAPGGARTDSSGQQRYVVVFAGVSGLTAGAQHDEHDLDRDDHHNPLLMSD